jgi:hypothetical protein
VPDKPQQTTPTPPQEPQAVPQKTLRQSLAELITKAEAVLEQAHELFRGDKDSVSHAYLIRRMKEVDGKCDRVLDALAELDDKHTDLASRHTDLLARTEKFAKTVNEKMRATR